MMEWTDRHCRVLMRALTRHAVLYTEMVTTGAILHGPRERLLGFDPIEHPIVLQLGGSEPADMARAAAIGADYGYDQININVGCPSDRVQNGRFGACLMAEPERVADCVAAMRAVVAVPVTVKCRIGIDDQDSERDLDRFVDKVAAAGCDTFIIHARKAWLEGLSPKENRDIPPLDYHRVARLKARRPELAIHLNGGVTTLGQAAEHLTRFDGVMIGRAAYHDMAILGAVDRAFFDPTAEVVDPLTAIARTLPYIERQLAGGVRLAAMTRHMLGLVQARPGARMFRRHLAEHAPREGAGLSVVTEALGVLQRASAEAAERAANPGLSKAR